jgi:hypothetical protein
VEHELTANETLQTDAAEERLELLLERPMQRRDFHHRSILDEVVLAARETPGSQGRRERS